MLLSFSANTIEADILEKTLIGRKDVVDKTELELTEKLLKKQTHQSLLIATRGSGKTHITKVLYNRIKKNKKLDDLVLVAYMNEDERGIANFSDFIRHILQSFVKNKEGDYETINDAIYDIAGLPSSQQEKAFVNYLLEFLGDKALVILIENLNIIFDEKKGMGLEGQQKFRSLMHENNRFSLMATSQNLFHQIQDSKAPFYQFFNIRHLQKLTFEQALEFIKVQGELDKATDLLEALKTSKMKGKVRAIFELTGGNHRLLVIFYHFLKTDFVADLSKIFEKTMNDLKPYYEQFLNALAPQQQKIVKYLSIAHTPKMGTDIARHCFIEPRTLSKQTSELVKKGYLDKHTEGRDAYYELKEPLMRICFEISENLNGITKLFVDFLSVMYDEEVLSKRYLEYKWLAISNENKKSLFRNESEIYGKALSDEKFEELKYLHLNECKSKKELDYIISANYYYNSKNYEKSISEINKAIKINPLNSECFKVLGLSYFENNKKTKSIDSLKKAVKINPNDSINYFFLGVVYFSQSKYKKVIDSLDKIIKINPNFSGLMKPYKDIFFVLEGLSLLYLKYFFLAVFCLKKAIELNYKGIYDDFTTAILAILLNSEQYPLSKLQYLQSELSNDIGHLKEMTIPLLYLDVGIRYLKQNDRRAIYDLSKEERALFKEMVLDKRINLNNKQTATK